MTPTLLAGRRSHRTTAPQSPEKVVRRPVNILHPTTGLMNLTIKGPTMIIPPTTGIQAQPRTLRRMIFRQWTITLGSDIET
ncbi:hypothetical protein A5687_11330 [Mycobacterium mantenii]|uniref:Uncharacterized protein n=1 Tax=Mycobacterium mantenii TaxID=560555 RepID=A0A1A2SQI6_MYCNT|nr:hypothetical protein A5688_15100 [Mycobacterium mantenii]OBH51251.1 hypothetical protein A5687_11330 [Mycobacterium mantenii]OBH66488.1 hypothetical protein A5683_10550 [Mycobacterium mantenii]